MRFRCFIGVVLLLMTLEGLEGATRASCVPKTTEWEWNGQKMNLTTCQPAISEVDDEDFTITEEIMNTDDHIRKSSLAIDIPNAKGMRFLPIKLYRNFPELVVVYIRSCSVTSVNEKHFRSLSKLRYLNLGFNKIEHVASDSFEDLVSLEFLSLDNNRIQSFRRNTFMSLIALETLYLHDNEIQFLDPKIFGSLISIELIHLSGNEISSLDENIFDSLTNLKNISMAENRLDRIATKLFKNNLKLEKIWFNKNQIKLIEAQTFDHLSSLKYVDIQSNLCLNKYYGLSTLTDMRNDLKQNCAEVSIRDTLETVAASLSKKIEYLEEQRSNLKSMVVRQSQEIDALRKNVGTITRENFQTIQRERTEFKTQLEALSQRIDAVNETARSVLLFDG